MSKPPVILVHGLKDNAKKMRHLAQYLEGEGWRAHSISLIPSRGQLGIDRLAEQLAAFFDSHVQPGEKADLVCFSMGGLVGRYYLQRMNGLERVRRFVTLATPHQGTALAYLNFTPGGLQMRPGSPFLQDLNRDVECLRSVHFTSFWTPLDLVILPPRNSEMPAAECRRIFSWGHPFIVRERRCLQAVAAALRQ